MQIIPSLTADPGDDDPSYQSVPNMRHGVVEYCCVDEYIAYRKCRYLQEVNRARTHLVDHLGPCK